MDLQAGPQAQGRPSTGKIEKASSFRMAVRLQRWVSKAMHLKLKAQDIVGGSWKLGLVWVICDGTLITTTIAESLE